MKIFKPKRYTPFIANAWDDPDQLFAEIGAAMSNLPEAERQYVQYLLDHIAEEGHNPDLLKELMMIRNGLVHNPDIITHKDGIHQVIEIKKAGIRRSEIAAQEAAQEITKYLMRKKRRRLKVEATSQNETSNVRPPEMAEKLLYLLPKHMRDPLLGDLEEDLPTICRKFGPGWAKFWYWWQALTSIVYSIFKQLIKTGRRWRSGS